MASQYPRGHHPNSIKNMSKPGTTNNPGGRPRLHMTDPLERRLDDRLPDDGEGAMLRTKFKLGPKATWRDAITEKRLREMIVSSSVYEDFCDRSEGRAKERLEISGQDNREIVIKHVIVPTPIKTE